MAMHDFATGGFFVIEPLCPLPLAAQQNGKYEAPELFPADYQEFLQVTTVLMKEVS